MKNHEDIEEWVLAKKYRVFKKIGSGSFGDIFMCENIMNREILAVKIVIKTLTKERKDKSNGHLEYELHLEGIAKVHDHGSDKDQYFMIMDLLGESLEDLFQAQGIQVINRLEAIHKKGFVHRDIKAHNFVVGKGEKRGVVYIIDFGLSKKYVTKTGEHIPFQNGKTLVGTARYASVASHEGNEQGRKDDMESLGFLLLYFAKGKLPWQGVQKKIKSEKYKEIGRIKKETSIQSIVQNLGEGSNALVDYFSYIRKLEFTEEPNYKYARSLFQKELQNFYPSFKYLDWLYQDEETNYTVSDENKGSKPPS